nr:hypothetical protein [Sulfurospirillum diekertiae]
MASRNDRYQMYVYANNFKDIDTTMLLYPKHLDKIYSKDMLGINDKKVILKLRSLELNSEKTIYNDFINEIKKRIEVINE